MVHEASEMAALVREMLRTAEQYYVHGPTNQELKDYQVVCKENAERWIESESEEPRSFNWACRVLGIDPDYMRRKLKEKRDAATRV